MRLILCISSILLIANPGFSREVPKTLAYSAQPTPYFDDHADEVAEIYDGLFFTVGSWDTGVLSNLGIDGATPAQNDWKDQAARNLKNLRESGVTENLLGVSFGSSEAWPSPETLLSEDFSDKMVRHFQQVGQSAKELGFRGVSIDPEYPYPRYELDHEVYTYEGYTIDDLLNAAAKQGREVMAALLDEFPDAVVFLLPGELWDRPIVRAFTTAMIETMADRDAPGGMHLGYERAYCLLDPVSQVAIPRVGDCAAEALLEGDTLDYWKRRCTVAPGVWPLHMIETGAKDYPVRPWDEELAELRDQMRVLRRVAKRYTWSYSGRPLWYLPTEETEKKYGLSSSPFDDASSVIPEWRRILREEGEVQDLGLLRLADQIDRFDRGEIDAAELCERFGTPGEWLVLGPLGNPHTQPERFPEKPFDRADWNWPVHGRDGVVRWFRFPNLEPLGTARVRAIYDWDHTNNCSTLLATTVVCEAEQEALLWIGWDDGVLITLNGEVVFDRSDYPKRGKGMLYLDRYNFEEKIPLQLHPGSNLMTVTSINSHGVSGFNLRVTDLDGYPIEGIDFDLPESFPSGEVDHRRSD
ncbi:MAG: hypothetical protein KC978_02360 [Candidatus Omnitrophica bacterium]|nr:hypothetical protein [Candidatus Omnitrophota bacterium]